MGLFVTFEGIEGCGKTTQIGLLNDFLALREMPAHLTREPGGTIIGDEIRRILLDSKNHNMVPLCELLLYAASRAQHVASVIQPILDKGHIVLCDRFTDATVAYQGYGRGFPLDQIDVMNQLATKGLQPDLTFLLDCDPKVGVDRALQRNLSRTKSQKEDRFDNEVIEFHQKVRQGYLDLAKDDPRRFFILDATANIEIIHQQVTEKMMDILAQKGLLGH